MRAEINFTADEWKWTMPKDKEWLKIEDDSEAICCQKYENTREHHRIEEHQITDNTEMIGIVGRLSQQNDLITSGPNATKKRSQVESVNQNE